ncbi:hypothetical protein SS50377_28599 [Spironucleus salmonicida]|uniref:Uncharacterized protein n=1 Tax=Spironucleus salmonicida TaxID=348837 RepID=A0A9P8LK83_9EUKA|nr:hypothetical protein SS50377_28599 [Spironucleus salmonicida]
MSLTVLKVDTTGSCFYDGLLSNLWCIQQFLNAVLGLQLLQVACELESPRAELTRNLHQQCPLLILWLCSVPDRAGHSLQSQERSGILYVRMRHWRTVYFAMCIIQWHSNSLAAL